MPDQPVSLPDVVAWIRESLDEYQGLYDVQDLTFIQSKVRVVTTRRDARYDLVTDRWADLADPQSRPVLTQDLRLWARQYLVQKH
jgi:hypothetical protein